MISLVKSYQSLKYLFLFILAQNLSYGIILYNGDNNSNITSPDTNRNNIYNSVAKISNENGSGIIGSAVHIKGKYLLTAEHVLYENQTPRRSHISFDGVTYYEIDELYLPRQISSADLVLFKLMNDPNLPEIELYNYNNEQYKTGTLIGWGYGRDIDQAEEIGSTRIWEWGNFSTIAKRWGTNRIESLGNTSIAGNTYHYLLTKLGSNSGPSEAAFANFDSGSGMFINHNGTWKLAGITTAVSQTNRSKFSPTTSAQDSNYFVRISKYRQTIINEIPDITTFSGWCVDNGLFGSDGGSESDPDSDGLNNLNEWISNTNPRVFDTDGDGLSDGDEVNTYLSDPLETDSSNDELSDLELVNYGLDPNVNHSLLYNAIVQSISDLRAGSILLNVANNEVTIDLELEESTDLENWTETNYNTSLVIPSSNNTAFYRFKFYD